MTPGSISISCYIHMYWFHPPHIFALICQIIIRISLTRARSNSIFAQAARTKQIKNLLSTTQTPTSPPPLSLTPPLCLSSHYPSACTNHLCSCWAWAKLPRLKTLLSRISCGHVSHELQWYRATLLTFVEHSDELRGLGEWDREGERERDWTRAYAGAMASLECSRAPSESDDPWVGEGCFRESVINWNVKPREGEVTGTGAKEKGS